jgi:hypothetical protein
LTKPTRVTTPSFYGHPDIGGIDIRIEAQFFFDIALDVAVGFHRIPRSLLALCCSIAALVARQTQRLILPTLRAIMPRRPFIALMLVNIRKFCRAQGHAA